MTMLRNYSTHHSSRIRPSHTGGIYLLKDAALSIEQTVNYVASLTHHFPGTLQKNAVVVPYLTVRENFYLFASKAHPKHRKIDLMVEDAVTLLDLSEDTLDQSFDSLPPALSLRLQWVLNQLCDRDFLVIDRWLWELPKEERQDWVQLFRTSAKETPLILIVLGDESAAAPFADKELDALEELSTVFNQKN
ncbi:hypothetical protein [Atopococcus tabaci]|uniref:hypothetical protein n=1 Tax=Atopococcus tabaci TaxID=269774 RepID=UPI00240A4444|nr:hypothetical protein [Atopococcus tabaci]